MTTESLSVASAMDGVNVLRVDNHRRLALVPADETLAGTPGRLVTLLATQCLILICSFGDAVDASVGYWLGPRLALGYLTLTAFACESTRSVGQGLVGGKTSRNRPWACLVFQTEGGGQQACCYQLAQGRVI